MNANDQIKCRISYKKAFRRRQCTAGEMKNYLCADYFPKTWTRLIVCIVGVSQTCAGNWKMAFSFVGNLSASEKFGPQHRHHLFGACHSFVRPKNHFFKTSTPVDTRSARMSLPFVRFFSPLLSYAYTMWNEFSCGISNHRPATSTFVKHSQKIRVPSSAKVFSITAAHRKSFFLHTTTMLFFLFILLVAGLGMRPNCMSISCWRSAFRKMPGNPSSCW